MGQLYRVNGHYSALTKVAFPLLVRILVVYPVLNVVRKKVFQFNRRVKPQAYFGGLPPDYRLTVSVHTETGRTLTEG